MLQNRVLYSNGTTLQLAVTNIWTRFFQVLVNLAQSWILMDLSIRWGLWRKIGGRKTSCWSRPTLVSLEETQWRNVKSYIDDGRLATLAYRRFWSLIPHSKWGIHTRIKHHLEHFRHVEPQLILRTKLIFHVVLRRFVWMWNGFPCSETLGTSGPRDITIWQCYVWTRGSRFLYFQTL